MKKRGILHSINRGRDNLHQDFRRTMWTLIAAILITTCLAIAGTAMIWSHWYPEEFPWIWTYCKAYPKSVVAKALLHSPIPIGDRSPKWLRVRTPTGQLYDSIELEARLAPDIAQDVRSAGMTVGIIWAVLFVAGLVSYYRYGGWLGTPEQERGQRLVTPQEIRRLIPRRKRGDIKLVGVPMPKKSETEHTLINGSPGTGKTSILIDLLSQIRCLGGKCVLYDPTGVLFSLFYRPGYDKLLNPFDARSDHWSPFAEARDDYDFDNVASWLIPEGIGDNAFFNDTARKVFADVMRQVPKRTIETLVAYENAELPILSELLAGTTSAGKLNDDNQKTSMSITSTMSTYTDCLKYLWTGERSALGIRDWMAVDNDSCLFLGAPPRQLKVIIPLLSCWIEAAADSALELGPNRRIFFIIDEMATLQRMQAVPRLLAQGRQYGVSGFLAFQSFSQLKKNFGLDGAVEMADLCSTRLILRIADADSAEWASKNLGEADLMEPTEAVSYAYRDGYRLSEQRRDRSVATPTEIMMLDNLHGYLRLSGKYPIVKIKIKPANYPALNPKHMRLEDNRAVSHKLPELLNNLNAKIRGKSKKR